MSGQQPYFTISSRRPADGNGHINGASSGVNPGEMCARSATHDISRASFHVKHIGQFARRLEDSTARAFPNRGRTSQRYKNVQALLLHWGSDDLFVLPELEDLEKCLRDDYSFGTDIFAIPSENSHLELMMRIGQLIKEHESQDTLFIIYYGGHARIDESRQSTWCATREPDSPWLQWSAIQTLLERSKSDVLILLDCCAGAASATFPTGNSITETISASSWDAIAPDPGRYSFTNALIEVLQEWRLRVFSAAMLHAEVLARLKHPRPITINGKHFEARSTPVHFMMTANHKAPSIELSRTRPVEKAPPPAPLRSMMGAHTGRSASPAPLLTSVTLPVEESLENVVPNEPTEDTPHVMISLALEEDQRLDINAWEQWLNAFPAMAKYVKIQGVFKSHSTLVLVSMPVMVWDMLPEDPATSFIAFIRSNNVCVQKSQEPVAVSVPVQNPPVEVEPLNASSAASEIPRHNFTQTQLDSPDAHYQGLPYLTRAETGGDWTSSSAQTVPSHTSTFAPQSAEVQQVLPPQRSYSTSAAVPSHQISQTTYPPVNISRQVIVNQQQFGRRTTFDTDVPEPKNFSLHVERRLEEYYQHQSHPNDGERAFLASNLGIEPWHLEVWFYHRRERDLVNNRLATMELKDTAVYTDSSGPMMILPADLSRLLQISRPSQTLVFDLRPQSDYMKSHVRGAINLRVPRSFIDTASVDMIGRAISEECGRSAFLNWKDARCIVFYSRALEHTWECPSASSMLKKLSETGWQGKRSFVLKGHYREFSVSFATHLEGSRTKSDVDGDQIQHDGEVDATLGCEEEYASWFSHVEAEERVRLTGAAPTGTAEHAQRMEAQEQELDDEFRAKSGDLYRKAQDVHSSSSQHDDFSAKARMVEYLDRGLTKIRNQQEETPPPVPYSSKLANDGYFDRRPSSQDETEEYVQVSKAVDSPAGVGPSVASPGEQASPSEDMMRKRRGSGIFNKVFRRA